MRSYSYEVLHVADGDPRRALLDRPADIHANAPPHLDHILVTWPFFTRDLLDAMGPMNNFVDHNGPALL